MEEKQVGSRRYGPVSRRSVFLLGALASLAVATANPSASRSAAKLSGHRLNLGKRERHLHHLSHSILARLRAGSTDPPLSDGFAGPPQHLSRDYQPPPQQQQQYDYPTEQAPPIPGDDNIPFQETFQDRVDTWRQNQLDHAEEQRSNFSPRDDQGRMKLMTSVGKGSRAITFFILMWRNVHLYEVADAKYKGTLRMMGVLPLTLLFVANMAGVVASVTSAGHSSKKRLKAILNLNKLVEIFLIILHVGKLLFSTSNMVPREIYISNILHSVFFILQCQAVTRLVWDEALASAPRSAASYPAPNQDEYETTVPQQRQPIQSNPNYQSY